jgi:hypothetical protein
VSKTDAIDETIRMLNLLLAKPKLSLKDKMAITDRIIRATALKLKHDDTGKGGKFAATPALPGAHDDAGNSSPPN